MTDPDLDGAVVAAYVHGDNIAASWHHSMLELLAYDLANSARLYRGGWVAMHCGTDGLVESRNVAVKTFLAERQAQWLWWTDTDMGFAPDTLDRLYEAADPTDRPIVGALCFSQREHAPDEMGGYQTLATPTVFDWATIDGRQGFAVRWDYARDTLTRCSGTGMACVLIHRSVFERLEEEHGQAWYNRVPNTTTGQLISEDLSFCLRAGALGIPIFVHTGVRTSHLKPVWLAERDYQMQRAVVPPATLEGIYPSSPQMKARQVPEATEPAAVLVPVLGRPHHAEPFMASLRASTKLAAVYAICQTGDDAAAAAWLDAGAEVLESGEQTTFAAKVNLGYAKTSEPWLFLVGSDVRFHPGWLDEAEHAAADGKFDVIGTNDLGNPRVTSGEHATHLLIRRDYVDRMGASWDGPGVVAHEGYRHWYVDDEIVTAAKQRGVWTMASHSIVEHLHPAWGKAPMDPVYELGARHVAADRGVFEVRCQANL